VEAKLAGERLSPLRLPSGRLRRKPSRARERMGVPHTIELLAQWAYDNRIAHADTPVLAFAFPYLADSTLPAKNRRRESVCRVLYELKINSDNALIDSKRALAQEAFDVGGDLLAMIQQMAKLNADLVERFSSSNRDHFGPHPDTRDPAHGGWIAALMNRLRIIAIDLGNLDANIRLACLPAPHDHEPRGQRPEPRQWLSVIEDLSLSGFENGEIAALVDDGKGGDLAARAKRVTQFLNRRKGNLRGTIHVAGTPVPSKSSQASG
jgi:hypothetical protein